MKNETNSALKTECTELIQLYEKNTNISEIMVNPNGSVFVEISGKMTDTGMELPEGTRESIVRLLAGAARMIINESQPTLNTRFPFGNGRFQGSIDPASTGPNFCIRFPPRKTLSFDDLQRNDAITEQQKEIIINGVRNKRNIVIAGSTSSGKTTLLNAIIKTIQNERIITIEDNPEILVEGKNHVPFFIYEKFSATDAVKLCLRYNPQRLIFGEVRDASANDMLKLWSTGHPGLGTIHASSAHEVKNRFYTLIQEKIAVPSKQLIDDALDIIVFMQKVNISPDRTIRKVIEIIQKD